MPKLPSPLTTKEETMYHVTPYENLEGVMKEGLVSSEVTTLNSPVPPWLRKGIYLDRDLEEAHGWAMMLLSPTEEEWEQMMSGRPVTKKMAILEVKVPAGCRMIPDPDVTDIGPGGRVTSFIVDVPIITPDRLRLVSIEEPEMA